jgi:hypothetical protein
MINLIKPKKINVELGKNYLLVPDTEFIPYIKGKKIFVECPNCNNDSGVDLVNIYDDKLSHIFHERDLNAWRCNYCFHDISYRMGLALNSQGLKEHYQSFAREYLSIFFK